MTIIIITTTMNGCYLVAEINQHDVVAVVKAAYSKQMNNEMNECMHTNNKAPVTLLKGALGIWAARRIK